MAHYVWSIETRGREPILKVTTVKDLRNFLHVLDLPGAMSPILLAMEVNNACQGCYTQNEGGVDEWKLTWTRIG